MLLDARKIVRVTSIVLVRLPATTIGQIGGTFIPVLSAGLGSRVMSTSQLAKTRKASERSALASCSS